MLHGLVHERKCTGASAHFPGGDAALLSQEFAWVSPLYVPARATLRASFVLSERAAADQQGQVAQWRMAVVGGRR